jgi:NAD(P)-dependent dehydrogenase (short-subunit alcohol dehydrogenase family)
LYISDINEPAAQKAAEYITKEYPSSECQSIKCDVSSEADIKTLVESAVAKWGRLDVMVSDLLANTGECTDESSTMLVLCTDSMSFAIARAKLMNRDDDAVNTEERIWDLTQAINVKGVWFGCKHAIIAMRNVSQLHSFFLIPLLVLLG